MASEYVLTAVSTYSAVVAIPIGLAALVLTNRGWTFLSSTSRTARTAIRHSEGKCETRLWSDLSDTGNLHVCTSIWPGECHGAHHVKDKRCWERSLGAMVNHYNPPPRQVDKPTVLPLSKDFLLVDLNVVLAFIFMTAQAVSIPSKRAKSPNDASRTFAIAGAVLDIQTIKPDLAILHIEGTFLRNLTKDYVERLLSGYPPLLNDPQGVSIFHPGDESRGGWVVALGLDPNFDEDTTFFAIYSDPPSAFTTDKSRRGRVFWRSLDRVRRIVTDIWAKAFASDPVASRHIALTIEVLEYMHIHETQSGVESKFDVPKPERALSEEEKHNIIAHFNGPPLIAESQEEQFQREWKPLLYHVLGAAVWGSMRCVAYFKNPGRELENLLPMEVLKSSKIYVRGC